MGNSGGVTDANTYTVTFTSLEAKWEANDKTFTAITKTLEMK